MLGGGEASPALLDVFSTRLDMKCELGDPWRTFEPVAVPGRRCQWDVAVGLALRPLYRPFAHQSCGRRVNSCSILIFCH